jgi:sulfur carrier protein
LKIFAKIGENSFELEFSKDITINDILNLLKIKDVLVVRNGEILSDDDLIYENETLRLVPIVSGG